MTEKSSQKKMSNVKAEKQTHVSQTPFQVHVRHNPETSKKDLKNIIDFTELKIFSLLKKGHRRKDAITLLRDMLHSYQSGEISISWKEGTPVYQKVS